MFTNKYLDPRIYQTIFIYLFVKYWIYLMFLQKKDNLNLFYLFICYQMLERKKEWYKVLMMKMITGLGHNLHLIHKSVCFFYLK